MKNYIVSICLVFLVCSCVTTPIKPALYDGQLPLYPAVIEAIVKRNAKLETADIFKDKFLSSYIYAVDILVSIRFKVSINKTNGYITSNIVGMQSLDSSTNSWSGGMLPLAFDTNDYLNKLSEDISGILNNRQRYSAAKDKYLSNLSFVHLIIQDMNDVGRDNFIDNNLKDRVFPFDLSLYSFNKNKNSKIKKKFVASFQYKDNNLGSVVDSSLYLYTDNEHYSNLRIGDDVSTKGRLVSFEKAMLGAFKVSLIEI